MKRRTFVAATAATAATMAAPSIQAQTLPAGPVRILVGFAPGGGTDILARIVAQKLQIMWGVTVLVDTAGRLQIDQSMMEEMVRIREACSPDEVLLVVDSMIGQEAAELTRAFHDQVGITGAVLTKLDGDSRGGAALSIRKVSGAPIKFIGTGEKVEALQPFHPERMASRILGMGDVLTLVEKAQKEVELADVERMQQKLQEASFDFSDFLQQMRLIKRMGSLGGLMKMIPGMNKIDDGMLKQGEEQLKKIEAMIGSMTETERQQPELLASQPSRRRRILRQRSFEG